MLTRSHACAFSMKEYMSQPETPIWTNLARDVRVILTLDRAESWRRLHLIVQRCVAPVDHDRLSARKRENMTDYPPSTSPCTPRT